MLTELCLARREAKRTRRAVPNPDEHGVRLVRERARVGGVVIVAVHPAAQQLLVIGVHPTSLPATTDSAGSVPLPGTQPLGAERLEVSRGGD
ncbi:hypothetical protein Sfulv_60700 [Streptomyces fulvorobeus]|uniref:Uncharacterized protein n=1 Tax=Streptomyces fulvorobeus TaxID=284028 RepID=A0A7J0CFI3_9ACTN|nr:hypothetical protein Sfulv_60700 [Streptomyces fulvorobeus]